MPLQWAAGMRSAEGAASRRGGCRTGSRRGAGVQRGFTLASLMIILAAMSIALGVAVQSVTFHKRRENEEELIFRGNQYVEAIRVFRARNGRFPMSLDELWKAKPRVIRRKWLDPITGRADWRPVFLGQEGKELEIGGPGGTPTPESGRPPTPTPAPTAEPKDDSTFGPGKGPQGGPIVGVKSRSCEESIKVYEGRTRYCEWKFYFDPNKQTKKPPGPLPTGGVPTKTP